MMFLYRTVVYVLAVWLLIMKVKGELFTLLLPWYCYGVGTRHLSLCVCVCARCGFGGYSDDQVKY